MRVKAKMTVKSDMALLTVILALMTTTGRLFPINHRKSHPKRCTNLDDFIGGVKEDEIGIVPGHVFDLHVGASHR